MDEAEKKNMSAETARLFEALLDWFPDIIQSVDASGHIVYANRKAVELLGYSHNEIIGMHLSKLYAPEIWEKVEKGFASLKSQGTLRVNESLICDKAGNRITVEIRSFAVNDQDGQFLRTFSILRDISETKDLQNQVLHSSRMAAIGELSACVAHDITNPLAVIKLYLELMQTQVDEALEQAPSVSAISSIQESVAFLQKSADKIEKLILHLREFSRSREAQMEPADLREVIGDALFMVTNKLERQHVTVEKDFPDISCTVSCNANQLEQAFMNLFSNACDAMRGGAAPVLRIKIRRWVSDAGNEAGWECLVSDNGPGVPVEVASQIFQPFFTTKAKGEGTGLGLSITRQIVLRHGGLIEVAPPSGLGATFILYLLDTPPRAASVIQA